VTCVCGGGGVLQPSYDWEHKKNEKRYRFSKTKYSPGTSDAEADRWSHVGRPKTPVVVVWHKYKERRTSFSWRDRFRLRPDHTQCMTIETKRCVIWQSRRDPVRRRFSSTANEFFCFIFYVIVDQWLSTIFFLFLRLTVRFERKIWALYKQNTARIITERRFILTVVWNKRWRFKTGKIITTTLKNNTWIVWNLKKKITRNSTLAVFTMSGNSRDDNENSERLHV